MLNVMGAIFVSAMFLGTSNSSTVQPVFAIERAVMYRYIPSCPFYPVWSPVHNRPGYQTAAYTFPRRHILHVTSCSFVTCHIRL